MRAQWSNYGGRQQLRTPPSRPPFPQSFITPNLCRPANAHVTLGRYASTRRERWREPPLAAREKTWCPNPEPRLPLPSRGSSSSSCSNAARPRLWTRTGHWRRRWGLVRVERSTRALGHHRRAPGRAERYHPRQRGGRRHRRNSGSSSSSSSSEMEWVLRL